MPSELRFCRNCGYRMGEGPAEYTETVRFPNNANGGAPGNFAGAMPGNYAAGFGVGGQMASCAPGAIGRKKRRMSGMSWIFIAIVIFFMSAGVLTRLARPRVRGPFSPPTVSAPRSYFGINSFKSVDGGVTFDAIEAPGSPADKAELVGGDVITSFDGQPVSSEGAIAGLLAATPIGKTVDITYIRDGETKTTKLTTISKADLDQLSRIFAKRPEGQGLLGYDPDDAELVEIQGTKLHGVRLGEILQSRPADLSGIKPGDIIIQFADTPIRSEAELRARVRRALPYTTVDVTIMRGSERIVIPIKMGRQ
jgi:S1-C subfamily serine protease